MSTKNSCRNDVVAFEKGDRVTTDQGAVLSDAEVLECESVLKYLIADVWRFYTAHIMHQGDTSIIVVRKEKDKETWQKAKKISYASLRGSSDMLFVDGQDVPDMAPKEWLRELVQDRLAVTSKTLNIFLPTWLLKILIEDAE